MSEHEQDQPAPHPEERQQPDVPEGTDGAADPAPQQAPSAAAQPTPPQYAPPVQPQQPQQPEQPEQQWIPVPPQNPYAAAPAAASGGRGLAIAAMALGLIALLTTAVAAAYSAGFVMIGAALGVIALALGITALVKRQRPRVAGLTGLTAGALAILLAIGAGVFAIGSALLPIRSGEAAGETTPPAETTPPEGDGSAIDWPANMATGGIIFGSTGGGDIEPQRSAPLQQGTAPTVPEVNRDGSSNSKIAKNDVLLYVDYRCPYCMHFEEQNSALLEAAMKTGDTTVQVVPLTFLDRASNGSYYSSRAAGAVACLVDQQPEAAWKAHVALLSSKLQPEEGISGPDNAQLISELEAATGGLSAKTKDCITTERFVPFAQALNNWVFANTIPNAKDATLRVEGTPTAVVNGVRYDGDPTDGAAFRAFFEEQTR